VSIIETGHSMLFQEYIW